MKVLMLASLWLFALLYTLYRHYDQQKRIKQINNLTNYRYGKEKSKSKKVEKESNDDTRHTT